MATVYNTSKIPTKLVRRDIATVKNLKKLRKSDIDLRDAKATIGRGVACPGCLIGTGRRTCPSDTTQANAEPDDETGPGHSESHAHRPRLFVCPSLARTVPGRATDPTAVLKVWRVRGDPNVTIR